MLEEKQFCRISVQILALKLLLPWITLFPYLSNTTAARLGSEKITSPAQNSLVALRPRPFPGESNIATFSMFTALGGPWFLRCWWAARECRACDRATAVGGKREAKYRVGELADQSVPSDCFRDNCAFYTQGTKIAHQLLNCSNRHRKTGWSAVSWDVICPRMGESVAAYHSRKNNLHCLLFGFVLKFSA